MFVCKSLDFGEKCLHMEQRKKKWEILQQFLFDKSWQFHLDFVRRTTTICYLQLWMETSLTNYFHGSISICNKSLQRREGMRAFCWFWSCEVQEVIRERSWQAFCPTAGSLWGGHGNQRSFHLEERPKLCPYARLQAHWWHPTASNSVAEGPHWELQTCTFQKTRTRWRVSFYLTNQSLFSFFSSKDDASDIKFCLFWLSFVFFRNKVVIQKEVVVKKCFRISGMCKTLGFLVWLTFCWAPDAFLQLHPAGLGGGQDAVRLEMKTTFSRFGISILRAFLHGVARRFYYVYVAEEETWRTAHSQPVQENITAVVAVFEILEAPVC